jgi:hypothetical protein
MKLIVFFCFFSVSSWAVEFEGNVEAQGRQSTNNEQAQKKFNQDWDRENFYLFYGNLNVNQTLGSSRFESNVFGRYAQSELYQKPYVAPLIYNFPQKLVARSLFDLKYDQTRDSSYTELNINKFFYEWDGQEVRLTLGRIYLNYGLGEVFNPINPFNQPTGLSSIAQTAQGNDGGQMKAFINSQHTVDMIILGDKEIKKPDDEVSYTFWVHGEYRFTDETQLDYVVGRDQERDKLGMQFSTQILDGLFFTQLFYQSQRIDQKKFTDDLIDLMVGYDQQLTGIWHMRVESGYQERSKFATLGFSERFLPVESFIALVNQFEPHPLFKVTLTGIFDLRSQFTYLIGKLIFSLSNNLEAEFFTSVPVGDKKEPEIIEQQFVTTDLGLALRMFF